MDGGCTVCMEVKLVTWKLDWLDRLGWLDGGWFG